jgi:large subunit ribosomal protein L15
MRLNEISPPHGSKKAKKRIGRGVGSGKGTTAGRGTKGQNSRSGGGVRPGFEGGQMPIHRRLPKRGFTNIFKKTYAIVNISDLSRFESGSVVDEVTLVRSGLVKGIRDGIKLLGKGEINYSLTIKVDKVSQNATAKIIQAGGKVEAS